MPFTLELAVIPRSSCTKLIHENGGLKLKITAPPVDGEANKKIIEFLSKFFSCSKTSIELISGNKSKKKKFLFHQLSEAQGLQMIERIIKLEEEYVFCRSKQS